MSRGFLSLLLALATVLAGCSGGDTAGQTATDRSITGQSTVAAGSTAKITLLAARNNTGPWVRSLTLEHGADGVPAGFHVCAAWDEAEQREGCRAAAGAKLPPGTILRLEQRPPGPALTTPDSPGWGTVGSSDRAELLVPLSDFVSGEKKGTVTYRVTLRPIEGGPALTTSSTITVTWAG